MAEAASIISRVSSENDLSIVIFDLIEFLILDDTFSSDVDDIILQLLNVVDKEYIEVSKDVIASTREFYRLLEEEISDRATNTEKDNNLS